MRVLCQRTLTSCRGECANRRRRAERLLVVIGGTGEQKASEEQTPAGTPICIEKSRSDTWLAHVLFQHALTSCRGVCANRRRRGASVFVLTGGNGERKGNEGQLQRRRQNQSLARACRDDRSEFE
jgi:hypothetical protein